MISKGTKMSYVAKIWLKMEVEFCNNPLNKQSNKVNAYDTADDELLSIDVSIHQEHLHLVTEVFLNQ